MLTSLKPAIRRSLPNGKELEKLLPEILDSRDTYTHLGTIIEDCATEGYFESYKVVAPEIFWSPKLYRFAIRRALESAIEGGHNAIAEHMLEEIHQIPTTYSGRRKDLVIEGLEIALSEGPSCCFPYFYDDFSEAPALFTDLGAEDFTAIPCEKCVKLVSYPLTAPGNARIAKRLRSTASEPADICLTVDGKTFSAHKDVLAYRSKYFAALFRGAWSDRDHVTFDNGEISPHILEMLPELVYGERCRLDNGSELTEDPLAAADYFLMDGLKDEIRDSIWDPGYQDYSDTCSDSDRY